MYEVIQNLLVRANRWHSVRSYEALVSRKVREHRNNYDLAMIGSIGALSMEAFDQQGDGHVAVLRHHGLRDGMSVYDLGCGSGRTTMALCRSGWQGDYLNEKCPGYTAVVHRDLTIAAPDESMDIVFHWSVFTHLYPEEYYLYMEDSFRALKPGGKLIFSFLELENPEHHGVLAIACVASASMDGRRPSMLFSIVTGSASGRGTSVSSRSSSPMGRMRPIIPPSGRRWWR